MSRRHRPSWLQGNSGRRFRIALAMRHGWRCFYCRRGFAHHTHITADHFIPRALWPRCPRWNIVPACEACNKAKDSTLPAGLVLVLLGSDVRLNIAPQAAA